MKNSWHRAYTQQWMSVISIGEAYLTLIIRFPVVEPMVWPECLKWTHLNPLFSKSPKPLS
jgi:hypothetical protein